MLLRDVNDVLMRKVSSFVAAFLQQRLITLKRGLGDACDADSRIRGILRLDVPRQQKHRVHTWQFPFSAILLRVYEVSLSVTINYATGGHKQLVQ